MAGFSRAFSETDHLEFARLSGDCNPVHIDDIAANGDIGVRSREVSKVAEFV